MNLLTVKNLTKRFGGLTAVSDLSFELGQGEILGLIGPNGAGKTTVFNCLTGFLVPEKGEITYRDKPVTGLKPHQYGRMGFARTFQIVKPFPSISVLDNVMVGALTREKSVGKARQASMKIIEQTGLGKMMNTEARDLPLPMRKRLELAKALSTRPTILFLDEVMAGLNPTEVDEIIRLVRRIHSEGVSVLLIEHVMRGVMALSQRVVVINYGEKIAEGIPEDVVKNKEVVKAYLGREFLDAQG